MPNVDGVGVLADAHVDALHTGGIVVGSLVRGHALWGVLWRRERRGGVRGGGS